MGPSLRDGPRTKVINFWDTAHCTIIEFPDRLTVIDLNGCKRFARETEAELRARYTLKYAPNPLLLGYGPLRNSLYQTPGQQVQAALDADLKRLTDH